MAALFGEHQNFTKFELWNRKAGKISEPDLSDNSRVLWGTLLEPAIAQGVAVKTGWKVQKVHRYYSDPDTRSGASLDFEIIANERGPGVLEIKTADWLVTRNWVDGEPPLSYELQLQHQLALTGRSWGVMAVLVGGNDLRLFEYERRPKTIDAISAEVRAFWQSIADNKPPTPNWEEDGETISKLYNKVEDGRVIDLGENNRACDLVATYKAAAQVEKAAAEQKDAAKAELLTIIDSAERALIGGFSVSCKMVAGAHIEYDRREYRSFRVTEKKAKAEGGEK